MTFKDLSRIIRRRNNSSNISSDQQLTPEQLEIEESRALLQQLHENYIRAYQRRRETWFARHPEAKYFEPSLEETHQDTEPAEWLWYFWEYMKQTPEQRYQDIKNEVNSFGHDGIDGELDSRECKPGCRFYPEEGRIEAIEVLYYYEKYQGFADALASWNAIKTPQ